MFNWIKNRIMKKNLNLQKEQYRGTLKQIMKVRGLRTISLANYNKWKGNTVDFATDVHSLKIDIQDGYLNIYTYNGNRCGSAIADASAETYRNVYTQVMNLLDEEHNIPYSVRKNILVKLAR